jgi:hypothetical protein
MDLSWDGDGYGFYEKKGFRRYKSRPVLWIVVLVFYIVFNLA